MKLSDLKYGFLVLVCLCFFYQTRSQENRIKGNDSALEHYGSNSPIRRDKCRTCEHKKECKFYWDVTKSERDMKLYFENERYDGYVRDNCLFRDEINIYNKMSAQIKYSNDTVVNYSLTTYSPYEGWKIAFNGMKGRIEAWLDIPFMKQNNLDQAELHAAEMSQGGKETAHKEPIIVHHIGRSMRRLKYLWSEADMEEEIQGFMTRSLRILMLRIHINIRLESGMDRCLS